MPELTPIPEAPGYVSTDGEAHVVLSFKISALIKFSKVPEIMNLKSDLLFFLKQNNQIHTQGLSVTVVSEIHAEEIRADSTHHSTAIVTTVQLLPQVKNLQV